MPYRYKLRSEGYYHIYNRGNNKQPIFEKDADYAYFIQRMSQFKERYKVVIICYCLMPNHFHFCLTAEMPVSIIQFMKQLQMVYAQYLQRTYGFIGHVFQGRYKAKFIKTEEQFIYLSAYIHNNPKIAGLVSRLTEWRWSSYLDYAGSRHGTIPLKEFILCYFKSPDHYTGWLDDLSDEKIQSRLAGAEVD